jgi:type II secretory pathway pseudopilin PulG
VSDTGADSGAPDTATLGRVAQEAGQTLTEMLVVLAILATVVGGLAVLFQGALKSQTTQNGQVQAQQQARAGLSAMTRELHCASSVLSPTSPSTVSAITVTLPSYCPGAASTTLGADLTIPAAGLSSATITVASNAGFNSGANTLSIAGSSTIVCSTAPVSPGTTFGGCNGGTPGTFTSGSTLSGAVTWCVTGSSLTRFVGSGSCPASGGRTLVTSLVGATPFTYARLPAPTAAVGANGSLDPGTYYYEVTAVVHLPDGSNVEIPGAVTSLVILSGVTTLTAHITWSAYTPTVGTLLGYNVYGRDNGSSSPRLTPVPEQPQGLRKLNPTLITSPLTFDDGGTIDTAAVTSGPPLSTISVQLIVDQTPADTLRRFELDDTIVLRNSGRF